MDKKILIIGAGGHGKVVKEVAEACGYKKVDFLDDNSSDAIGKIQELNLYLNEYENAIVGIGNNLFRNEMLDRLKKAGYQIPVLIHPTAYVSPSAIVSEGTVIEPLAIVNANSQVCKGCIISVGAIVDHNVVLEECVHVNAGAIVKAGARVVQNRKLEAGEVVLGY